MIADNVHNIHHCVVSNQPENPVLQQMQKDAKDLGWRRFVLLGDRSMKIGPPDHFGAKLLLVRAFLGTLPDMDIVLFTDAHDVRVIVPPRDVVERFLSFNAGVVVSAERNCWPNEKLDEVFKRLHPGEYRCVNSGGYIGYVRDLKFLLNDEDMHLTEQTDDQDAFTFMYLKYHTYPHLVQLDTACKIFQCLHLAHDDIDTERRRNKITLQYPLIWHGNGSAGRGVGDPVFCNHVCMWKLDERERKDMQMEEQEVIQSLARSYEQGRSIDSVLLEQIATDYPSHPVVQYMLGLYYKRVHDWYHAIHHLKKSIHTCPLFPSPAFELVDTCHYLFQDYPVDRYLKHIFDCETTKNPMLGIKAYDEMDQLRVCSLLGPYYERKRDLAAAKRVYQHVYDGLRKMKETGRYEYMPLRDQNICSQCWKNVCMGLQRVSNLPEMKNKYLAEYDYL